MNTLHLVRVSSVGGGNNITIIISLVFWWAIISGDTPFARNRGVAINCGSGVYIQVYTMSPHHYNFGSIRWLAGQEIKDQMKW